MKKLIGLLAAAMLIPALASCGGSQQADTTGADTAADTTAAESDWAQVQEKGVLTIGVTNYPPMNYLDDNGNWTGFDTEFAQAVAEELGIDVTFTEISWDAKETELASRNIDALWNGMCITPEREEAWEITTPYMYNTQAMVMKADREAEIMADVAGKNVVSEAGSTGEEKVTGKMDDANDPTVEVIAADYFKDANHTGVSNMATALMDVQNGIADIAVVDSVIAEGMINGDGSSLTDLVINTDNKFGDQWFGAAFRKGSDICPMVNEAMKKLVDNGKLMELAQKYGLTESVQKAMDHNAAQ